MTDRDTGGVRRWKLLEDALAYPEVGPPSGEFYIGNGWSVVPIADHDEVVATLRARVSGLEEELANLTPPSPSG